MRTASLLAAAATAAILCAVAESQKGWFPVPDIDAPKVQQLGRWAVTEHDKKANDKVRFIRVVSGEETMDPQLVGIKYHLVIDASDGSGQRRKYEAVLGDEVWDGRVILISFNPAK